jgi:hypothetical protein
MDNELLFILIFVITVIANIIKAVNKNKKRRGASAPSVSEEGGGKAKEPEWQKILRELMGETEPVPQPAEVDDYNAPGEERDLMTERSEEYRKETYNFEAPVYTQPSLKMKGFDVEQSTDSEDIADIPKYGKGHQIRHNALKEFDLRSAIIYNAVLNRPY